MPLQFTVLASGSSGNASLIEVDGFGLLLDAGLGPRLLARRLAWVGASWGRIHAVLLTHTHADHWRARTFAHCLRQQIPVYCHFHHRRILSMAGSAFAALESAGLVRLFEAGDLLLLAPGLRCRPLPVRHDDEATFAFRFEGGETTLAYAADLGCWDSALAGALTDVDILALEFNHDVGLECTSGRPAELIARVLGDDGHLSNSQAADLLREVLRRSTPGRVKHLIQLHLSRECNRRTLAVQAARTVLEECEYQIQLHTASQYVPTWPIRVEGQNGQHPTLTGPLSSAWRRSGRSRSQQLILPGMQDAFS